ncbi:hypothetical protein MBLNU459_g3974t1 [Dothideomycetes sp. NU459]
MQHSGSKPNDSTICAVSLLAGWELEYGDELSYESHMLGLKTMINLRGGLHAGGFSVATVQVVLAVTHDLALYAGKESAFLPSVTYAFQSGHPSTALPEGFSALRKAHLVLPAGLDLVQQLHFASVSTPTSDEKLCFIQRRLIDYDPVKYLAVDYCPVQSAADDEINYQAEHHIRLAALCVARRLRCSSTGMPNRAPLDDQYSTSMLHPDRMVGTVYAEVCMWSLFIICTTVAPANKYLKKVLQRLIVGQDLRVWSDVANILAKYLYPLPEYDAACRELWCSLSLLSEDCEHETRRHSTRYDVNVFTSK